MTATEARRIMVGAAASTEAEDLYSTAVDLVAELVRTGALDVLAGLIARLAINAAAFLSLAEHGRLINGGEVPPPTLEELVSNRLLIEAQRS